MSQTGAWTSLQGSRTHKNANPGYRYSLDGEVIGSVTYDLRPIREWFDKAKARAEEGELYDQIDLLEELAPLISSESELQ